jgi:hypothetical protein
MDAVQREADRIAGSIRTRAMEERRIHLALVPHPDTVSFWYRPCNREFIEARPGGFG